MEQSQERVVLGERQFDVVRFWEQLPAGLELGVVSTVAAAADGTVFVAQRAGAPVLVFEADGSFRTQWDSDGVLDPHGINIAASGEVLLVDRDAHEIQIRSQAGEILRTIGTRHRPAHQTPFNHPTSAFMTPDGEVYVADGYGNSAVHRFAADGSLVSSWGRPGSGDGEFSTPHSVWVDRQERVLIADRENNRISVFDRDGSFITHWTGFHHPMDIAQDSNGAIYVSDQVPRLSQLNEHGELTGRCRPVWNVPHGFACAPGGTIHLIEMKPSSLVTLVPC